MKNNYKHTCQIKGEGDQGLQILQFKIFQELINLLHKLMVKPLLKIPTKQVFYPFPQVGNLVGQFNNNNASKNSHISNLNKAYTTKYMFKHKKG